MSAKTTAVSGNWSSTPTAAGVVILRMVSRAAAGNGAAYFDTIVVA